MPSVQRIREVLDYDPRTGILRWLKPGSKRVKAGDVAGTVTEKNGHHVTLDGERYLGSRVIWVWMTGQQPPRLIDHRDINRNNNAWDNLRPATYSQNGANRFIPVNSTSGYKGVTKVKGRDRWLARIKINKRQHYLGHFRSPEDAHAAYLAKAIEVYGEFARAA